MERRDDDETEFETRATDARLAPAPEDGALVVQAEAVETDEERAAREQTDGKLPIEMWAEQKGMLPQLVNTSMGLRANPENWKFAAAKAFKGWAAGTRVSEQEFDEAVAEQNKSTIR